MNDQAPAAVVTTPVLIDANRPVAMLLLPVCTDDHAPDACLRDPPDATAKLPVTEFSEPPRIDVPSPSDRSSHRPPPTARRGSKPLMHSVDTATTAPSRSRCPPTLPQPPPNRRATRLSEVVQPAAHERVRTGGRVLPPERRRIRTRRPVRHATDDRPEARRPVLRPGHHIVRPRSPTRSRCCSRPPRCPCRSTNSSHRRHWSPAGSCAQRQRVLAADVRRPRRARQQTLQCSQAADSATSTRSS